MRRLKVETIQEIKKKLSDGLSDRKIALALHCSRNTVAGVRKGLITEQSVLEKATSLLYSSNKENQVAS